MAAFLLMALVACSHASSILLTLFPQPCCLLHDVLMDVMWVPVPEGFDWVISWWCCFFGCYGLQWLLQAILTNLLVDPQLLASGIVPPTDSFVPIVHLSKGVPW